MEMKRESRGRFFFLVCVEKGQADRFWYKPLCVRTSTSKKISRNAEIDCANFFLADTESSGSETGHCANLQAN